MNGRGRCHSPKAEEEEEVEGMAKEAAAAAAAAAAFASFSILISLQDVSKKSHSQETQCRQE